MSEELGQHGSGGEIVLYTTEDGLAKVQLRAVEGTVWLTQAQIAELYQVTAQAITQHLRAVYAEGELTEEATCNDYLQVRSEGGRQVSRTIRHYNLAVVIAIGYRVRSPRGTQFRRWATTVLSEYLIKGFAMDDARLKDAPQWDYFDELLERVRDIRASEKRFYQKVRDIFATAVDYDPKSDAAKRFFAMVQNKMLFAVTGKTAAELIGARADAGSPNMGLTAWAGARVRKGDVTVGKNYLDGAEVEELNRIVVMYLDFAEDQARRRREMTMVEWADRLDAFLSFNDRELLTGAGKLRKLVADSLAEERFSEFDAARRRADLEAADATDFAAIENLGKEVE